MKRALISLLLLTPAALLLMRLRPRRGWHKGEVYIPYYVTWSNPTIH